MAKVRRKGEAAVVEAEQESGSRALWLGGALAVLLLAVLVIVLIGRGNGGGAAATAGQYEGIATEGNLLGAADAPVVIREFLDFKCPHCEDAHSNLVPKIISDYVAAGTVRMEFIPVAFLGEESRFGAEGAFCAEEQGQYMAFAGQLFANQRNTFNIDNMTGWAEAVGMDGQQFRGCVTSGKYRNRVEENLAEARRVGASSTPTFLVNEVPVVGAVPFDQMQAAIDAQLSE